MGPRGGALSGLQGDAAHHRITIKIVASDEGFTWARGLLFVKKHLANGATIQCDTPTSCGR